MFKTGTFALSTSIDLPPMSFPGIDLNINHINILPHTEPINYLVELQAYHSQVDKLNDLFDPDLDNPM